MRALKTTFLTSKAQANDETDAAVSTSVEQTFGQGIAASLVSDIQPGGVTSVLLGGCSALMPVSMNSRSSVSRGARAACAHCCRGCVAPCASPSILSLPGTRA